MITDLKIWLLLGKNVVVVEVPKQHLDHYDWRQNIENNQGVFLHFAKMFAGIGSSAPAIPSRNKQQVTENQWMDITFSSMGAPRFSTCRRGKHAGRARLPALPCAYTEGLYKWWSSKYRTATSISDKRNTTLSQTAFKGGAGLQRKEEE